MPELDSSTLIMIAIVVVAFAFPTFIRAVGKPLDISLPFGLGGARSRFVHVDPETAEAAALLTEIKKDRRRFESSRTRLEVRGQAYRGGRRQRIELIRDGWFALGAIKIDTTCVGNPERPGRYEETFINKDRTVYIHTDGRWKTEKVGDYPPTTGGHAAEPGTLLDRISRADTVTELERSVIHGIECRVFRYSVRTKADPRRDLVSLEPHLPTKKRYVCDRCDGEFAIGIVDNIIHQHIQELAAHTDAENKESCEITHTYTVWDLNNDAITVEAPKGVQPAR